MALIKGADKGVFGVDEMITRDYADKILERARRAVNAKDTGRLMSEKGHNFVSRGDFAKAVCDSFPALREITPPKNSRAPFRIPKHRNSEYAEVLGRLGILDVYGAEQEFYYGRPVTKGEAADIVVRACVEAAGL